MSNSGVAAGKGHGICECGGGAAKGRPTSREPPPRVQPLAGLGLLQPPCGQDGAGGACRY